MSFVGLILRHMESADGFQILVYRSFSLAAIVLFVACLRRKSGPLSVFSTIDRWSILVGILLGFAFSFYVYALLNTSIASALFLLSSSPIFAAVLAWVFIGEKPTTITYAALALAITGVTIMVPGICPQPVPNPLSVPQKALSAIFPAHQPYPCQPRTACS